MESIQNINGLYEIKKEMPCAPEDITIAEWWIPKASALKAEEVEIAARLIHFSQKNEKWVGVTTESLQAMFDKEKEDGVNNFSVIRPFGDSHFNNGMKGLMDREMLRIEEDKSGEETILVLVPTPKLANFLIQAQKH